VFFIPPFSELALHTLTHTQCVKSCLLRSFRNKTQHHPMRQILSLALPQQKTTKTTTPNASNPVSGLPRQKRTTPNSSIRQISRLHSFKWAVNTIISSYFFSCSLFYFILFFLCTSRSTKTTSTKQIHPSCLGFTNLIKDFPKLTDMIFFSKCVFYWVQLLLLLTFLTSSRFDFLFK